jgi:hypothetical protein
MTSILTYQVLAMIKTGKNAGNYKDLFVEAENIQDAEFKGRKKCKKLNLRFICADFDDDDNEGLNYF